MLSINRATGNQRSESKILNNLGSLAGLRGRMQEAWSFHEQALAAAQRSGNRSSEASALLNLGCTAMLQGRLAEARAFDERALQILRDSGNRVLEGLAINNLAHLDLAEGLPEAARAKNEQALAIHRQVGNRPDELTTLSALAELTRRVSADLDTASRYLREARGLAERWGNRFNLILCLCEQGHLALAASEAARPYLQRARERPWEGRQGESPARVPRCRPAAEAPGRTGRPAGTDNAGCRRTGASPGSGSPLR